MTTQTEKALRNNLYARWAGMKHRCENANNIAYKSYGGRGINVCDLWQEFNEFYKWALASGYSKELQIDRIDNDKGYSPKNCRWVTAKENSLNRRDTILVEINGHSIRLWDLSQKTGISYKTLQTRYRLGDRGDCLIRPIGDNSKYPKAEKLEKKKIEDTKTWLKNFREKANLTQEEVASMAGISRANYCHIENGRRNATEINAKKIADTLGFDWKLFLQEKDFVT